MKHSVIGLVAALVMGGAGVQAEEKPFELVPAQLVRPRAGVGNVLAKLKAGKEVRIAYFGGSITAAAGWRVKTLKWFQETYPNAKVSEIHAAIGGTGSDLGVFRCGQDVLRHKPDLIFVEFAVNDGGAPAERIWQCMEGIVRQAWKADPTTDICYVYTFRVGYEKDLDQGLCPRAASADEVLADYYGIPSINVAMRTAELARQGKLIYVPQKDAAGKPLPAPDGVVLWSTDGVHPLDAGHEIYSQVVADAFKEMDATSKPGAHALKAPFRADNWENAKIVPIEPWMVSAGWKKLDPEAELSKRFRKDSPELWEATAAGEKISFRFRGTAARLYDVMGPDAGQAVVTVDGKASPPRSTFDSYCSWYRLGVLGIADGLPEGVHTVSVEVHPDAPDRTSVTDKEKLKPDYDPKKYEGIALRFGGILLRGEIVRE